MSHVQTRGAIDSARTHGRFRPLAALLLFALGLAGCSNDDGNDTAPPAPPAAAAPTISAQPTNVTADAGLTATFSVTATGTPAPTYQWRKDGDSINGATSASYTTPATTAADDGAQYTVVVTNSAGSVTSNAATLTVNYAPSITTQPTAQSVTAPATATFTVAASGKPTPTLQWQASADGTTWSDIAGATSVSYTTAATAVADSGKKFRAVATNSKGSATSDAATLTVTAAAAGPAWQTAAPLRPPGSEAASQVYTAASGTGDFVAVWVDASTSTLLKGSFYVAGSGWQEPAVIAMPSDQGDAPQYPSVGMDAQGHAIVVFTRGHNSVDSVWTSQATSSTTWSPPTLLEMVDGGDADLPVVAVAADGSAVAVWQQNYYPFSQQMFDTRRVVAARYTPADGWREPVDIDLASGGNGLGTYPKVSLNATGDAVVAWAASTPQSERAVAALLLNGTWTSADFLIPVTATNVSFAWSAFINDAGDVAVSGRVNDGGGKQQFVARRPAGSGAWLAPDIVGGTASDIGASAVVLAADGAATLIWQRFNGFSQYNIVAAQQPAGGTWSTPEQISTSGMYTDWTQMGIDAGGNVVAVWLENPGNYWYLKTMRLAPGGAWTDLPNVEVLTSTSTVLDRGGFALGANGQAVLAWGEADGNPQVPWANLLK
ncbi:MAG TPA: immunoglobulin domain-containing protein [Steroidobacteraceae bacterium]